MSSTRPHHKSMKNFRSHQTISHPKQLVPLPSLNPESSVPKSILPTISERRQAKKQQAKSLTHAIAKFKSTLKRIRTTGQKQFTQEILKSAISVMSCFGSVQNNFQDLFVELLNCFEYFCYPTNSKELLKKYVIRDGTSFKQCCQIIQNETDYLVQGKNAQITSLDDQLKQTESKFAMNKVEWGILREELEYEAAKFKKLANVEYVLSLESKISALKSVISNQDQEINKFGKENEIKREELEFATRKIEGYISYQNKLKDRLHVLEVDKENKEKYILTLQDRFDELMIKMVGLREIIQKVEKQNEELTSERMKLVNRAAVSFTELTPRPKYGQIFNFDEEKVKLKPTTEIVGIIVEHLQGDKSIISQSILQNETGAKKLVQAEKIRKKVSDHIRHSKKEGKRLL